MPTSPSEPAVAGTDATDATDDVDVVDVVVVGAGPAGVAAAIGAAAGGARVVVLDSEQRPGGQYWRHGPSGVGRHHHDVGTWHRLAAGLAAAVADGAVTVLPAHRVWRVEAPSGAGPGATPATVHAVRAVPGAADEAVTVRARALVVATGAHDRALPFPGWDLPGVLTAGAAQALLKEHDVVVGRRVLVAGTGPFLLPVAAGLAEAGATVLGVCEAGDGRGWLRGLGAVAGAPAKVLDGARYAATLVRHRVPVRPRTAVVAAHGSDRLEWVETARLAPDWTVVPGTRTRVDCDALAVGYGFLPRLDLVVQAGCAVAPGPDGLPAAVVDARQRSTVPGIYVAGETCGVGGADVAVAEGGIAGAAAAADVRRPPRTAAPHGTRPPARLRRLRAFAAAMHVAHPVRAGWQTWLTDDTLVCRCEEVTVAGLTSAVDDLGATDARTAKLLSRCGMGWCQGRMCGEAVSRVVSARTGADPRRTTDRLAADLAGTANRPVAAPITLGLLAQPPTPTGGPHV